MKFPFSNRAFAPATFSIKSKAALFATVGATLLFVLFGWLAARYVHRDMQQVLGSQQLTLVTRIADELDDKIRMTHRALIVTAAAISADLLRDPQALEQSLQNQPGYRSLFDDVFVISRDGRVLIDLPKLDRRGIDVSDRNYYRNTLATRAPVISEPYMGRGLKEPGVMMTAPILDRNGEVAGMLTGVLHPLKPNLLGKLTESRVGRTGSFALFTRDRTIVVSLDRTRIMTRGPEPGVSLPFDHAVAGQSGWEEGTNSQGLRALFSYKPLTEAPWILAAALPIEEAYAPITIAQGRVVGMAALLALLVAPLVWFGTRFLLAPISELRDTIRKIQGDPAGTAIVPIARSDEIGDLATDFNRMIEHLRERTRTLNAEKELNRQIIETSPVGISLYDENGDCIATNEALARHIGATREQVLAQNYHCIDSWKRYGVYELAQRAVRSSAPVSEVLRVVTSFGKDVWLGITFCSLQMEGHRHLMQITSDLTEIKQAELALVESERKYRSLVTQASDGIFIVSAEGRYIDVNEAWSKMLGYTREEALEHKIGDFVSPDDLQRTPVPLERLRNGQTVLLERYLLRKDGGRIWTEVNTRMLPTGEILGIVRDISERLRADVAVRESQRMLKLVLDTIPTRVFWKDRSGHFLGANRVFARDLGVDDPEALIGKSPVEFQTEDEGKRIVAEDREIVDHGVSRINVERSRTTADGRLYWRSVTKLPLRDEQGHIIGSLNTYEDVTARKQVEAALHRLNAELEQRVSERTAALSLSNADLEKANAELGDSIYRLKLTQADLIRAEKLAALGALVAGVAHEINTPIGNALMVASTLREKSGHFAAQIQSGTLRRSMLDEYTGTITQGSELLMRNLGQAADLVLSFKQVAVDQSSAQRRGFDLKETIEEVLSTLHHLVRSKPIRVVTHLAEGVQMDSYPGPLGQVLNNLFNNALIHGLAGREGGEIVIETRREREDRVVLEVRDDGSGIAEENLGKVFDPFFTTRLGQGGSGLGLNIVHNIVTQLLGGRITVESPPGRGATFKVVLPLIAPASNAVSDIGEPARSRRQSTR